MKHKEIYSVMHFCIFNFWSTTSELPILNNFWTTIPNLLNSVDVLAERQVEQEIEAERFLCYKQLANLSLRSLISLWLTCSKLSVKFPTHETVLRTAYEPAHRQWSQIIDQLLTNLLTTLNQIWKVNNMSDVDGIVRGISAAIPFQESNML